MQNPLNDLGVPQTIQWNRHLQARDFCQNLMRNISKSSHTTAGARSRSKPNAVLMRADSDSLRKLELSKGPEDPAEAYRLEQEMGLISSSSTFVA
jgi:hypothetical protein